MRRKCCNDRYSMGVNVTLEFAKLYRVNFFNCSHIRNVIPPQDIMFDSNIVDLITRMLMMMKKFQKFIKNLEDLLYESYCSSSCSRRFNVAQVPEEFIKLHRIGELPSEFYQAS